MSDLQKFYEAKLDELTPLIPAPGLTPVEYAGAMQAFLTCAVDIAKNCYQLPDESCTKIVHDCYALIGERMQRLVSEQN